MIAMREKVEELRVRDLFFPYALLNVSWERRKTGEGS